jgi:hypothetical protein
VLVDGEIYGKEMTVAVEETTMMMTAAVGIVVKR